LILLQGLTKKAKRTQLFHVAFFFTSQCFLLTAILLLAKGFGDSQTFLVEQASDLGINGWRAGCTSSCAWKVYFFLE